MQVKLKVTKGSNAGAVIQLPVAKFMIGRGEDCHLRPKSDAVSRHHCAIVITPNQVVLRDFGSRNGSYVNGEAVTDARVLQQGDILEIGPLEFELLIDHSLGGIKKPKVKDVKEAAARTAAQPAGDQDISDWLGDDDESEIGRKIAEPETRQFRLDETERMKLQEAAEQAKEQEDTVNAANDTSDTKSGKKRAPGKLPPIPKTQSSDSREAAQDMLRKFFNRG